MSTTDIRLDIAFKKVIGIADANPQGDISTEGNQARSSVLPNAQIYQQPIPSVAPAWSDMVLDTTFSSLNSGYGAASAAAAGSITATVGYTQRYVSITYPYIAYYSTIPLKDTTGTGNARFSYYYANSGTTAGVSNNLLQYSIPSSYDPLGSYAISVYNINGIKKSSTDTTHPYFLDNDSGIITYTNGGSNNYSYPDGPPSVSFWRYEGAFGIQNFAIDMSMNKKLSVAGDVSMGSRLYVSGNIYLPTGGNVYVGGSVLSGGGGGGGTVSYTSDLSSSARLYVTNDISFGNRLFVRSDVSLGGRLFVASDLSVNGGVSVSGDVLILGRLNVREYQSTNIFYTNVQTNNYTLIVSEDMSLNGRLNVNFDASLNSRLFVSNDVSLGGRLFVASDLSVNGSVGISGDVLILGRLNVREYKNTSIFYTNVQTNNYSLVVTEDLSVNGRLLLAGDVSMVTGNIFLPTGGNVYIGGSVLSGGSGTVSYTSDLSSSARLYVTNDVSFGKRLFVGGDASLGGTFYTAGTTILHGDVSLNNDLFVGMDASFGGKLYTAGTSIFQGDVSMNNRLFVLNDASFGGNFYNAGRTIHQGDVSMNNRLFVGSDVSLGGRLFVASDLSVNGGVGISGDVMILGRLNVREYQNTSIFYTNVQTNNYSLVITEDVSVNGRLFVSSGATLSGINYMDRISELVATTSGGSNSYTVGAVSGTFDYSTGPLFYYTLTSNAASFTANFVNVNPLAQTNRTFVASIMFNCSATGFTTYASSISASTSAATAAALSNTTTNFYNGGATNAGLSSLSRVIVQSIAFVYTTSGATPTFALSTISSYQ